MSKIQSEPFLQIKSTAYLTSEIRNALIQKLSSFFSYVAFKNCSFSAMLPPQFQPVLYADVNTIWETFVAQQIPLRPFMHGVYLVDRPRFTEILSILKDKFPHVLDTSALTSTPMTTPTPKPVEVTSSASLSISRSLPGVPDGFDLLKFYSTDKNVVGYVEDLLKRLANEYHRKILEQENKENSAIYLRLFELLGGSIKIGLVDFLEQKRLPPSSFPDIFPHAFLLFLDLLGEKNASVAPRKIRNNDTVIDIPSNETTLVLAERLHQKLVSTLPIFDLILLKDTDFEEFLIELENIGGDALRTKFWNFFCDEMGEPRSYIERLFKLNIFEGYTKFIGDYITSHCKSNKEKLEKLNNGLLKIFTEILEGKQVLSMDEYPQSKHFLTKAYCWADQEKLMKTLTKPFAFNAPKPNIGATTLATSQKNGRPITEWTIEEWLANAKVNDVPVAEILDDFGFTVDEMGKIFRKVFGRNTANFGKLKMYVEKTEGPSDNDVIEGFLAAEVPRLIAGKILRIIRAQLYNL